MVSISRYNFDFFKEMYLLELENKERINARVSVPLSIIPLLVGGGIFLLTEQKDIEGEFWYTFFVVTFTIFFVSLITSIVYTIRAYYNYEYQYIPSLSDIAKDSILLEDYVDRLIEYEDNPITEEERVKRIEETIQNDICEKFIKATDRNIGLNEKKLFFLRRVGIWLMISLISGALCIIPTTFGKSEDVQKVEIIEAQTMKGK